MVRVSSQFRRFRRIGSVTCRLRLSNLWRWATLTRTPSRTRPRGSWSDIKSELFSTPTHVVSAPLLASPRLRPPSYHPRPLVLPTPTLTPIRSLRPSPFPLHLPTPIALPTSARIRPSHPSPPHLHPSILSPLPPLPSPPPAFSPPDSSPLLCAFPGSDEDLVKMKLAFIPPLTSLFYYYSESLSPARTGASNSRSRTICTSSTATSTTRSPGSSESRGARPGPRVLHLSPFRRARHI